MAFHDVRFPDNISYASSGGPSFRTEVIELDSGQERRLSRWSQPRHRYNVAYGVKSYTDLTAVKRFFMAREGAAHSFRYKDWLDFTTASDGIPQTMGGGTPTFTDQLIGLGDGSTKTFQLVKRYSSGTATRVRTITKPIVSTVTIALDGVQESGSNFTVDGTTGIVSFTTAPGNGVQITWGGEFDVHVRFAEETDDLLSVNFKDFGSGDIPSIQLVELLDPSQFSDEFFFGGAAHVENKSAALSVATARVWALNPTGGDVDAVLPEITVDFPPGGPYFYVHNQTGSGNNVIIKDSAGSTITTATSGHTKTVLLMVDESGDLQWLVF